MPSDPHPAASDIFLSARLKLKRADQHIKELTEFQNYLTLENRRINWDFGVKKLPDGGYSADPKPDRIFVPPYGVPSLIAGDAIHNIRTALDHMATELVVVRTGKSKKVYFPFSNTEAELEQMIKEKGFDACGDDCVKLLKEQRPYRGGNALLRAIHDLDIDDKHKFIMVATPVGSSPSFKIFEKSDGSFDVTSPAPADCVIRLGMDFDGLVLIDFLKDALSLTAKVVNDFAAVATKPIPQ